MDEQPLAPGATTDSIFRYQLARDLADLCPPELGREIALTGSASRGMADDDSDIEFVAWVDAMPSAGERLAWLTQIGATDFAPETHTSQDGTVWHWSRFRGVWLETGWQEVARHELVLRSIAAGEILDHRKLTLADAVTHAISLRTTGLLATWQGWLASYPDRLQDALIRAAARRWTYAISYWSLARRNDRVAVAERILAEVHEMLRIIFALNRAWEPAWKWAAQRTGKLAIKPEDFMQRVDDTLLLDDLERSLKVCAELFRDTLLLVPAVTDVSVSLRAIEESLRERSP